MTETSFEPTYVLEADERNRRRAWLSLRKLLVLMVLLAAVPLAVVELVSNGAEQRLQRERSRDELDALARALAGQHRARLNGIGQFLVAVSQAPPVVGQDREGCARYFSRLRALEPGVLNIGLIGTDGRLVCEATGNGQGVYLGDREYFREALRNGQPIFGAYQIGRITGRPSVVLARPVPTDSGRVAAIVYAALDLAVLTGDVGGQRAPPGIRAHLVDAAGVVLGTSGVGTAPIGEPLADLVLRQAVLDRRSGRIDGPPGEEPARLRTLQPVDVGGRSVMFVAATVAMEDVIAPLQRNLFARLAGILAIVVAIAALVWLLGQRLILRPVERLVTGMRQVESGDHARALDQPPTPLRELGDLQRSLSSLVITLEAQRFERDQALGALSDREARYRELFKANPQVMFVYDVHSLRLLAANEAAAVYYGYTRDDMLKKGLADIWPGCTAVGSQPGGGVPVVASVWHPTGPVSHRLGNGETRQVEVVASSILFEGLPAALVMVTDVTERLAAQAREREGAQRLEQRVADRTRELELSLRELEAFSYSVSHDLRNPLGAVGMFGQMLQAQLGEDADEQVKTYLARIEQGVRGMERLIDDLLTLAKVARAPLTLEPVDLTALCRDVVNELRQADPHRAVDVSLEEDLHCTGDAGLLRQMLVNLLGNAWKFTARTPQPRICVGREPGFASTAAAFFVQDNGAGFDMKFAGRLFLPFERLHGDHDFPGTGIGLATVQRIVARHGGRIWAEAALERGATFHLELGTRQPG